MKWLMIFLFCLFACNSTKNVVTDAQLNGNWELVIFPGSDKAFAEIFGERKPQLEFEVLTKKFSGTTGCNRISGTYDRDSSVFHFGNDIMMTKMGCPGYDENIFLDALKRVNNFQFMNNQLHFRQDTSLVMAFARKQT